MIIIYNIKTNIKISIFKIVLRRYYKFFYIYFILKSLAKTFKIIQIFIVAKIINLKFIKIIIYKKPKFKKNQ